MLSSGQGMDAFFLPICRGAPSICQVFVNIVLGLPFDVARFSGLLRACDLRVFDGSFRSLVCLFRLLDMWD